MASSLLVRDDTQLAVRDWGGQGRPIVLIHGLGGRQREWDAIAHALTGRFRVVTYDQRGHGESGQSLDYSWATRVDDLAALLLELELHDVVLVGHSLGAGIALAVAERTVDCHGLVLLDGAFPVALKLPDWRGPVHRTQSVVVTVRRAVLHRLLGHGPMSYGELTRVGDDYRSRFSEYDQALGNISCPGRLILGAQAERGRAAPAIQVARREAAVRAAAINPRLDVQWIEARHSMVHTHPMEIAAAIALMGADTP